MKCFIMLSAASDIPITAWQRMFPNSLKLFYGTVIKGLQLSAKVRMKPHASPRNFPAEWRENRQRFVSKQRKKNKNHVFVE